MHDNDAGDQPVEPRPSIPDDTGKESDSSGASNGRFANRPPGYPNAFVWLRAGIVRDWRGALGSFIATWFYLPVALIGAVVGAIVFGVGGLYAGGFNSGEALPAELRDVPLVGTLIDAFVARSGGVLGGILSAGLGFLAGFILVALWPWRATFDEPTTLVTGLAGAVAAAILVGLVYTLYRVLLEPWLLRVSGARQLSRREAAEFLPVLHDCAQKLGLPGVPRLLIEDNLVLVNAHAYSRHIVVTTALRTERPEVVAALLSHELVHWRTGDEVTSAFVRGVALPLFLIHAVPTWLMRSFPHPATNFIVFIFFWPVLLTMRYLVMPFHAHDVRAAEYRADLGAVLTGNVAGMRSILEMRRSFETGRSGWDSAVCATHPASELRLDRLEQFEPATVAAPDVVPGGVPGAARPVSAETLFGGPGSFGSRRSWLIGGAVLLACCLVSSLLGVVQWGFFRPQATVDGYFAALADRDSSAALDRLAPDTRARMASDPFLAKLVASKHYQPPTDVRITSVERDDDRATAKVSFKLAGDRMEQTLALRRNESSSLGLFRGWHIEGGLAGLTLPANQAGIVVNGVGLPQFSEPQTIVALPGVYVLAGQRNALSETPQQPIVAIMGAENTVYVTPTVLPEAQARADAAIRKYLDGCAAQTVAAPRGCPFSYYGGTVQQISWKITEYPTFQIELADSTTARVSTPYEGQGTARSTGRIAGYYTGSTPFQDTDEFSVSGTLTVAGEELTFQPTN